MKGSEVSAVVNCRAVALVVGLLLLPCNVTHAQHLYFDTDGNGISNASDCLDPSGETLVRIYLDTLHGRDGIATTCDGNAEGGSGPLDMFSYDLILKIQAKSGSVRWGEYKDAVGFIGKDRHSAVELLVSRLGQEALPPGLHRLGEVSIYTLAGSPVLQIGKNSTLDPAAFTGFGTHCSGSEYLNSYVFGTDWTDTDSMGLREEGLGTTSLRVQTARPGSADRTVFALTLASPGRVRLAIYDVGGRLVHTLINTASGPVGNLSVTWDGRTRGGTAAASGVYFARLDASGHKLTRKFALVK